MIFTALTSRTQFHETIAQMGNSYGRFYIYVISHELPGLWPPPGGPEFSISALVLTNRFYLWMKNEEALCGVQIKVPMKVSWIPAGLIRAY